MSYQGEMPLEYGKPQQVGGEKMVPMNAILHGKLKELEISSIIWAIRTKSIKVAP